MAQKIQLEAEVREITGGKVKTLRADGIMPAVIYGKGFEPVSVQIPQKDFEKVFAEAGESTLVYINVKGEAYPTIIHDVARDPISGSFQHADFYKVRLDEKIHAKISLSFVGEAPAVKSYSGILVKNITELEVEGLPQDLPHEIVVDISKLVDLKSQILVKDLSISGRLEIKAKPEEIIVLVQEPISEEELKAQLEAPTAAAPEEVEVIKKEKLEAEAEEGAEEPVSPAKKPTEEKK